VGHGASVDRMVVARDPGPAADFIAQGVAVRTQLLQQANATVTAAGTSTQGVISLPYH
jgi:hypothetical protein